MNYTRQGLVNEIPKGFQENIKEKNLLLVGCGGVGSVLANLLVRGGFRNLDIVDNDVVDETNLQRQLYDEKDIGKAKSTILKKNLLAVDPLANITSYVELVDEKFLGKKNYDLIIDATDNFMTRKYINEFSKENSTDWLFTGAIKNEVLICMFLSKENKFDHVFSTEVKDEKCCDVGVLASTTFTSASLAYNEVVKYFIGDYTPKLIKMNLWSLDVHSIEL